MVFSIDIVNIGNQYRSYCNISDIDQYYRVNIVLGTSKPDTILLLYIGTADI